MSTSTPRIRPASPSIEPDGTGVPGGPPVATFGHHPRRTIPFMIMLVVMMIAGLGWLFEAGMREGWITALVFILLPGLTLALVGRDVLRGGPVLIITEDGLIDRRRGPELIAWDRIAEASARRRLFIKSVRILLTDGSQVDIDMGLLNAEPQDIIRLIQAGADRQRE